MAALIHIFDDSFNRNGTKNVVKTNTPMTKYSTKISKKYFPLISRIDLKMQKINNIVDPIIT
jgi:hypothetical protein